MKSMSLDVWFTKKSTGGDRRMSALPVPAASDSSVSAGSTASTIQSAISSITGRSSISGRQRPRRHKSASAPTITYMGRSFCADGSDDTNKEVSQRESAKLRRQSDVKLLAEMAATQDEIATENLKQAAWRHSTPAQMQWSADKKIEPFNLNDGSGGMNNSYSGPSDRRRGRRPSRHESLRKKLAYTDADLLKIAQDDNEFRRLKAGLKNKGAVTNEVLKQRLYAFVAKSKLRHSDSNASGDSGDKSIGSTSTAELLGRRGSTSTAELLGRRGKLQATKSEDLSSLRRAHTIPTDTSNRR